MCLLFVLVYYHAIIKLSSLFINIFYFCLIVVLK
nr:MAG TPA: hypothetical protein [Caudoviricetes sp.]